DFEPDSSVIAPVATYNAAGRQLTVYVRNGESTVGQVLAAINAVPAFPMTAVLSSGPFDGSATFTADLTEETVFVANGGSESGIVAGAAASFVGGEEPTPASAHLTLVDRLYGLAFTSKVPGADANGIVVRLLDD